jgi:hypothetical protein
VTLRRVIDAAGHPTDRRTVDERRELERRAADDRRERVGEPVGIPPELDRALARAVLDVVGADDAAGAAEHYDVWTSVDGAVTRVADALAAQGAGVDAILFALEDAFAALTAGQRHHGGRAHVQALAARARDHAAERLARGGAGSARRPS